MRRVLRRLRRAVRTRLRRSEAAAPPTTAAFEPSEVAATEVEATEVEASEVEAGTHVQEPAGELDRSAVAAPPGPPGPPPVALGPPSPEPSLRATFRDPVLQEQFDRLGYAVAQVLDPEALAGLLAAYDELEHRHEEWLPFAEGFHTTLYDDRHDYRCGVTDAFDRWLAPGLDRVLADHRIQFANFQVKLPGAELLPEHVDWTFVDEQRVRSVTVWTATHDIDERIGGLGVAPGSHRLVDFDRAVNHRYYERHAAAAEAIAERRVVPLRAGEAIIFDNRLLHWSGPNATDGPRLAASCVATPAEEPVFHYWFDEHDRAHRVEVAPAFWLSYAIGSDPRTVPGAGTDTLVAGRFA